ncbi:MAG: orotate phosphoribosyltransferase [Clostridia bacterium]
MRKIILFGILLGKIGPYFINAQFLYGSEKESNELLNFINYELENTSKDLIPKNIFEKVLFQYENNTIYATIINALVSYLNENIDIDNIDYVSGGERRDWFFSNIIAFLLKKPHITVYKDLSCVLSSYNFSENDFISDLNGKNVLHVADILNQGSSYLRAWIPAIKSLGANIKWSLVCIDRNQGGTEKIKDAGIIPLSLLNVDIELFEEALNLGIINENQLEMLKQFVKDPDNTMREFLINHPDFLENALNSDEKTAKRAKLCIENNFYDLK